MAKNKKKSVELKDKKISFVREGTTYKVIRFYPTAMSLDVMAIEEGETKGTLQNIPYAHATKDVKKLIKPN